MSLLSVSIVVYRSDPLLLAQTLRSLNGAVAWAEARRHDVAPVLVTLVDNAPDVGDTSSIDVSAFGLDSALINVALQAGQGNVGYGCGHNLAIAEGESTYHLILNPDVNVAQSAVSLALAYFESNRETVAIAPRVTGEAGELQYLCRRYPTMTDLFVRGFLPARWRRHFDHRLARYEMRADIDRSEQSYSDGIVAPVHPQIISGCFMLFRTETLRKVGGFDPRYFLYFEDYDLSLRAGRFGKLAYVPSVNIVHYGGGASRKGLAHIKMFAASACRFFHRFGWVWA